MSRNEEYECAISGTVAEAALDSKKDGLAGLPPGWTKLTVEHREVNPKWMAVRDLKSAMVENIVRNFPEEQREVQRFAIELQIDAQFAALEEATPIYQTSKEIVYLAPRETAPGIKQIIDDLRDQLGLESLAYEGEDDDPAEVEADGAAAEAQEKKKKT
jgi:hypothetical protein